MAFRFAGEIGDAVKAAGLDPVDGAGRRPGSFVVADGDFAVGADAHAVGSAKAACEDFELGAVLRNFEKTAMVRRDFVPAEPPGRTGPPLTK